MWAGDSYPAGVAGSAGGLLGAVNDVIPRYRDGLAGVAQQLAPTSTLSTAPATPSTARPGATSS